jgi:hypothetical protein
MQAFDEQHERELEVRVAARTEELSTLSTHLLQLAESERSALAKELHDELGGLITAAKMDLSWLSSRLGESLDAPSAEKLNSVMQMLNQAMVLKRRVVESLRPSLARSFRVGRGAAQSLRRALPSRRYRVRRIVAGRCLTSRRRGPAHVVSRGAGNAGEHHRARRPNTSSWSSKLRTAATSW